MYSFKAFLCLETSSGCSVVLGSLKLQNLETERSLCPAVPQGEYLPAAASDHHGEHQ